MNKKNTKIVIISAVALIIVALFFVIKGQLGAVVTQTTCYQESANVATACGGLATGIYSNTLGCAGWNDGDWRVGCGPGLINSSASFRVDYYKPDGFYASSTRWIIKDAFSTSTNKTLTIPSACLNTNPVRFLVQAIKQTNTTQSLINYSCCINSTCTNPILITTQNGTHMIMEEAMLWGINTVSYDTTAGRSVTFRIRTTTPFASLPNPYFNLAYADTQYSGYANTLSRISSTNNADINVVLQTLNPSYSNGHASSTITIPNTINEINYSVITITYNETLAKVYINGVLRATEQVIADRDTNAAYIMTTSSWAFGRYSNTSGIILAPQYISVTDVVEGTKLLSDAEALAQYNTINNKYISSSDYVVYFPMNNPSGFDSIGTATLVSNGIIGTAYRFSGDGSGFLTYATANNTRFQFVNSFTAEAWVRPENLKHSYVVAKPDTFMIQLYPWKDPATNITTIRYLGGVYTLQNGSRQHANLVGTDKINTSHLGKWMHLAFTYDTNVGAKFYTDGKLTGSCTTSDCKTPIYPGDMPLAIGNRADWQTWQATPALGNRAFNGTIDEVKIYNRALTATEILTEYNRATLPVLLCTPNTRECVSGVNSYRICAADGMSWATTACASGQTCTGAGICNTICTNDCATSGTRQCYSTIGYQTCGQYDTDSCLEWSTTTSCASGQTCGGAGVCSTVPPVCTNDCATSGARQCSGVNYQTCGNYDADSCLEWSTATACASGQTCTGTGTCTNVCTPTTCLALGRVCGSVSNGCSGTLNCGTCLTTQTCNANGQCINNQVAATCADLNKACGIWDNQVGGTVNCGACAADYTCNLDGQCVNDVVTCRAYETTAYGASILGDISSSTQCKFSVPKLFTNAGFGDFQKYNPILFYIALLIIIAGVGFGVFKLASKKRR